MGLFDRFKKPKWQHEDWKIRLDAIKELDDQEILAEMAKNDSNIDVRLEAIKNINNDSFLKDIIKNDGNLDILAVTIDKIEEESVLIDIAKNDSRKHVRVAAIRKISDESVLIDIAKNDLSALVRLMAVEKISDESVLIDIIKNDSSRDVPSLAVNKISDESVLIDLAKNSSICEIRSGAVKNSNLKDESVLADIAKNDSEWIVRAITVGKISDESVLADIAKNDSVKYVREDASERIKDLSGVKSNRYTNVQDYVDDIARSASHNLISKADELVEEAKKSFPNFKEDFDDAKKVGIKAQGTKFSYTVNCPKCGREVIDFTGYCYNCKYQYIQVPKGKWTYDTSKEYEDRIKYLASENELLYAVTHWKEATEHFPENETKYTMIIIMHAEELK